MKYKITELKHLLQFKIVNSKQLLLINGRFIQDVFQSMTLLVNIN